MRLLLLILLALYSVPSFAQDFEGLLKLPEGATVMNVSATERTEVKQDLLTATLRFQFEDEDLNAVQNAINSKMKKALDKAKKAKSVQTQTLRYNVYQQDANRGKRDLAARMIWRGEQSLQLKSTDTDAVLELTGELQKIGLSLNGLGFSVSTKLRDQVQSDLLEKALARLTAKAERAGKALGKNSVELLKVNVGHNGSIHQPRMMMRSDAFVAEAASMAAPVAEAGESEISLNVDAVALLKP